MENKDPVEMESDSAILSANQPAKPDLSRQKVDVFQTCLTTVLLLGPLSMGLIITQLSNRTDFSEIYANKTYNPLGSQISYLWNLGGFFPLGGFVGAWVAVFSMDIYGRRRSTMMFFAIMILANIFGWLSLTISFGLLVICRFLGGLASAGLMVVAVCWIMDRLPDRLVIYYKPLIQLLTNTGIIFSQAFSVTDIFVVCNYLVFLMPIAVSVFALACSYFIGESIRWMMTKNYDPKIVQEAMQKLRGDGYIEEEYTYVKEMMEIELKKPKATISEIVQDRNLQPVILVAMVLHMAQQFSGINVVIAFSEDVLQKVVETYRFYTIGLFVLNCLFSLIACPFVAKLPRKLTLLISHGLMALGFLVFIIVFSIKGSDASAFIYVLSLAVSLLGFQFGLGPLVWFIVFEMFPERASAAAQGLCSSINWLANSIVFFTFPLISDAIGKNNPHYALCIFLCTNILGMIFVQFFVIETLNRPVESVLADYRRRWRR